MNSLPCLERIVIKLQSYNIGQYPEQMNDSMSSENSDEEGFFANKIQIKEEQQSNIGSVNHKVRNLNDKNAFQTKYLPASGALRKEPIHSLKTSHIIRNESYPQSAQISKRRKTNLIKEHPYTLYATSQSYTLVYCRNNESPILNQPNFMRNQVLLTHVGNQELTSIGKHISEFKDKDESDEQHSRPNLLKLSSRFECGNLHCAYKHKDCEEYILFVQNDTNSLGYNQWFYFSVEDMKPGITYSFKLVNLKKKHSFFKYGARPFVYSSKEQEETGSGWARRGFNISYDESPVCVPYNPQIKYYCLSFDLVFKYSSDFALISMGLPYSYTKLTALLQQISMAPTLHHNAISVDISSIGKTVCNNDMPEITITGNSQDAVEDKKMIIFMARQHPGEVWSSFMMESIIRYLTGTPFAETVKQPLAADVQSLLQNYIIKIYPMVNVDGVIYGNFRCDITGTDLNRKWKETSKVLHPQVHSIKQKIRSYSKKYSIDACFDLHGHSKNYNIFCYSCRTNIATCRILPKLISTFNSNFYLPSCTFGISKYKESTARAAIFRTVRNENVLTIESSFYGSKLKQQPVKEYDPQDIYKMGEDIVKALRIFTDKQSKIYKQVKLEIETNISKYLEYDEVNLNNSGSDSDPQGDEIELGIKINELFDSKYLNQSNLQIQKTEENIFDNLLDDYNIEPTEIPIQPHSAGFNTMKKKRPPLVSSTISKKAKHTPFSSDFKTIEQIPDITGKFRKLSQEYETADYRKTQKSKQTQMRKDRKKIPTNASERSKIDKDSHKDKSGIKKSTLPPKRLNIEQIRRFNSRTISTSTNRKEVMVRKPPTNLDNELSSPFSTFQSKVEQEEQSKKKHNRFSITMKMSNKNYGAMFDEEIYNQDQNPLLNTLFHNKRKLEEEKSKLMEREQSRTNRSKRMTDQKNEMIRKLFNKPGNQPTAIFLQSPKKQRHSYL